MDDAGQRKLLQLAAERLLAEAHSRKAASSVYDFVKIKVRLGNNLEHYYILSRFLLSRMLTVITLPPHKAVRIALDVKKQLVDHDRLDITQDELEEVLFAALRQRGYGDEYVRRYQMVTRFFQQKRPLIILIAGSACTGKSSLAQQLASRLNLPNVLQTDVLYELLRAGSLGDLPAEPLWRRPLPPGAGLVGEFQRECAAIRRALDGDLCKCIRDGKSIIIEGMHLDPGLFLLEFGDARGAGSSALHTRELSTVLEASGELVGYLPATEQAEAAAEAAINGLGSLGAGKDSGAVLRDAPDLQRAWSLAQQPAELVSQQTAAAPAAAPQVMDAAVRRTASFSDAVHRLSHASLRRLQSPWRGDPGSHSLLRPMSARMNSLERGQAVFMLQTHEEAADIQHTAAGPYHSPRPAPCISLPPVLEHSPQQGPRRTVSLPSVAIVPILSTGSGDKEQGEQAGTVPYKDIALIVQKNSEQQFVGPKVSPFTSMRDTRLDLQAAKQHETQPVEPTPQPSEPCQPQTHGSVAAADAAAAAAAGMGPVFVPICLSIRDEEYEGMLRDWLQRQQRALDCSVDCSVVDGTSRASRADDGEAVRRLRELQEHLRQYSASGVPVVECDTGDMGQALDAMHAYVLQCIEIALALE